MKTFRLPDLGEGLPDADIREWYVAVGDEVQIDQPLVAMETAKALVDVPAPFSGTIEKLFGKPGDTIHTGDPLIGFEGEGETDIPLREDSGTVVGQIEASDSMITEHTVVDSTHANVATPGARALARRLAVDLDALIASGQPITLENIRAAAKNQPLPEGFEALNKTRRAMILSMSTSHQSIVPVTLTEDADIQRWPTGTDTTLRLVRAVAAACQAEPMLNATFDSKRFAYRKNPIVNLGIAVDTPHGLYVPVLQDITHRTDDSLREQINRYKIQANEKTIPQEDLKGATIMLSNFGAIAGRYANPIVVPPMVAIIGIGRSRNSVVAKEGEAVIHRIMPLSLTVDHRIITGGETARFLKCFKDCLEQENG